MTAQPLIIPSRSGYLNTALTGLPGPAAVEAARGVLDAWASGTLNWGDAVDQLDVARRAFAAFVGVGTERIGVGHTVAATLSGVAANLPENAVLLAPAGEHNSNIYPYLHHAPRGVRLEFAPLEHLADALRPYHAAVAFGLVQSADGRIADLPAISAAAQKVGALTLVDVTQACGWFHFDPDLCDVFISACYKWLMTPNGPAFIGLSPRAMEHVRAGHRSWVGNLEVHAAPYGPGGQSAPDARRFDVVPNFIAIAAAVQSLNMLADIGIARIEKHNLALVHRFCEALDLPPHRSSIISIDAGSIGSLPEDISFTLRGGKARFSFHLYNDEEDVAAAVDFVRMANAR
ncbi:MULTISPECIES: aminotransferase class V-fold PLP-dependent enzyme [unclassified Sphingobium]|uniref:aminotransferase class V-fold PLP-dependent enzyme n=1 Tax=unclassified Sphingobium TaxID=2611147 RepID=UPI0035A6A6C0